MTKPKIANSPPRARLAFRVGIVGHRPNRLPEDRRGIEAIRERLAAALVAVKSAVEAFRCDPDADYYAPAPPLLCAVSPLAEGADRAFAEEALALGYCLCCPFPFSREVYEADFAHGRGHEHGSIDRFRAIVEGAAAGPGLTTFELDGSRGREGKAYGSAGRVVLNQSDLLIVVWDGGRSQGAGGTVDTLHEAFRFHVPVLWIDARAPFGWTLLREASDLIATNDEPLGAPAWRVRSAASDDPGLAETIRRLVFDELRLPSAPEPHKPTTAGGGRAARYFDEHRPSWNYAFVWKLFRDLVGAGRLTIPPLRVEDYVDQVAAAWPTAAADPRDEGPPPTDVVAWVNAQLRPHFAWADRLAERYADAHRSANVVASLFAAAAVFLALLPMAVGWSGGQAETVCIVVELVVLLTMVGLLVTGRQRHWHERWLDYRVLAELIRQLRLLIPLGGGRPLPRTPAHLTIYGDPSRSWMYWHVRAIARSVGLPDVRATPDYRLRCLAYLADVADGRVHGQLAFHRESHDRSRRIHDRLHYATLILLYVSVAAIGGHLALQLPAIADRFGEAGRRWLVLTTAVAPALGAALASINNQGEFARLAKRSRAMAEGFAQFSAQIDRLRDPHAPDESAPSLAEITPIASRMAEMMVDENIDWRVVVLDLPHVAG